MLGKRNYKMESELRDCYECKTQVCLTGAGSLKSSIMIVGLAPKKAEAIDQKIFSGPNGRLLQDIIESLGIMSKVYFTNLIKKCIDSHIPSQADIAHHSRHLSSEFAEIRPDLVIALGSIVTEFLQPNLSILKHHGLIIPARRFAHEFKLLPVYDLGYVVRKGGLISETGEEWLFDIEQARDFA